MSVIQRIHVIGRPVRLPGCNWTGYTVEVNGVPGALAYNAYRILAALAVARKSGNNDGWCKLSDLHASNKSHGLRLLSDKLQQLTNTDALVCESDGRGRRRLCCDPGDIEISETAQKEVT